MTGRKAATQGGRMLLVASCVAMAGTACTPTPRVQAPTPVSEPDRPTENAPATPAPPAPPEAITRRSVWSFSYTPATYLYSITTNAEVAPLADTTQRRATPEMAQQATVAIDAAGNVEVIDPVPVSGGPCDASDALVTRARELIPRLPTNMVIGQTWSDSTTTSGCRGSVPATSHTWHVYTVIGDTVVAGIPALHVHRADTISASGEGAEGQHRVLISASGNGNAELFFDVTNGRFLGSDGLQTSTVEISASGKATSFLQHVTEHVVLTGIR